MVWNHPEISKEDFTKLLKGFVDMLILASGFQSSGVPAQWDAENCGKALQWGLFFEKMLRSVNRSDPSGESVREVEEAISEIKSNPLFPKGLEDLSSDTLSKGREFVLEHLMNHSTLKDKHQLQAVLVAAVESGEGIDGKLCERQAVVSCVSALETGLKILSRNFEVNELIQKEDKDATLVGGGSKQPVELVTWNKWQSRSLSYFLSKRTLRLVSGASLIFTAPRAQWAQVLRRLHVSAENREDMFIEKIELLLLGCVTSRWTYLIEAIMSVSYKSVTVSEQYEELCKLLLQRSKGLKQNEIALNSNVEEILEYLTEILKNRSHHLWKFPSALTAAAIPSWSPLFALYFGEIEKQLKLDFSARRCCSCDKDLNEHKDCELAERVWCLYVFHIVCGCHQTI